MSQEQEVRVCLGCQSLHRGWFSGPDPYALTCQPDPNVPMRTLVASILPSEDEVTVLSHTRCMLGRRGR